jgi:hypothetical protein
MLLTRLRGHSIGAVALTIAAIAGTSASAGGVESAAGEPVNHGMAPAALTHRNAEGFATPDELLAELPDHTGPRAGR